MKRLSRILLAVATCTLVATLACASLAPFSAGISLDLTAEAAAATSIAPTWTPTATFTPTATPLPDTIAVGGIWPGQDQAVDVATHSASLLAVANLTSLNIFRDDFWFTIGDMAPTRVVFSPDGGTLAAGDSAGMIHLLNATTGEVIAEMPAHTSRVRDIAYSPNGRRFATAGDDSRVTVWDSTGRESIAVLSLTPGRDPAAIAWMPDGLRVLSVSAGNDGGSLVIWDVEAGSREREIVFPTELTAITSAGDGNFLLGGADGSLFLWASDRDVRSYLRFPDGKPIAAIRSNGAGGAAVLLEDGTSEIIWNETGDVLHTIGSGAKPLTAVSWAARNILLAATGAESPIIYTIDVSAPVYTLPEPTLYALGEGSDLYGLGYEARTLAFIGEDLMAGSSGDQSLRWAMASDDPVSPVANLYGPSFNVSAMAISPDGARAASALQDGRIVFTDISGDRVQTLATAEGAGSRVTSLLFTPDGAYCVSGAANGDISLWNPGSGALMESLAALDSPIITVGTSASGDMIMAAAADGSLHFWSLKPGDVSRIDDINTGSAITAAAFSSDGLLAAVAHEDPLSVQVYDVRTGKLLRQVPLTSGATAMALLPGGLAAVCQQDQHLTLWQALRAEMHADERLNGLCRVVTFSNEGDWLAAGLTSGGVTAWEITHGD